MKFKDLYPVESIAWLTIYVPETAIPASGF